MQNDEFCPQTGKMYIILLLCLFFTCLLIGINCVSVGNVDDVLFGFGICISVIQILYTIYIVVVDIWRGIRGGVPGGVPGGNIIPIFVLLLSSSYMMAFGIIGIEMSNTDEPITNVAIASILGSVAGMLLTFNDVICSIACRCSG